MLTIAPPHSSPPARAAEDSPCRSSGRRRPRLWRAFDARMAALTGRALLLFSVASDLPGL